MFSVRSIRGWVIALGGSVLLNLALFGLMPGLIQRLPAPPESLERFDPVRVVRVKRPEPPPRKKRVEKTAEPKPVKQIKPFNHPQIRKKNITVEPRINLDLNPNLPAAPMDLAIPVLEQFSMQAPALKDLYEIGDLDTGLTALVKIPPIYPVKAKRRGIEGAVTVEFTVTAQGLVNQIDIVEAKPPQIFNSSVIACVSQWKFKPPTVEGIPVAAKARTTIRFKLE